MIFVSQLCGVDVCVFLELICLVWACFSVGSVGWFLVDGSSAEQPVVVFFFVSESEWKHLGPYTWCEHFFGGVLLFWSFTLFRVSQLWGFCFCLVSVF